MYAVLVMKESQSLMLIVNQDPCAPMYDPVRGLYHLHYQFHPNHISWGKPYLFAESKRQLLKDLTFQEMYLGATPLRPISSPGPTWTTFLTMASRPGKTTKQNQLAQPI